MRLGIDLGGSHIAVGVVNPKNGAILEKEEQDIEFIKKDESHVLQIIEQYIQKFSKNYEIDYIGIATPGNPNKEKLIIENLVNLGIKKLNFKILEQKFNLPFSVKNDSKAAGIAEFKFGSLTGKKDAIFLCLGTGIGSAVFLNEKLLQSNKHIGFELGHMIIDKNGLECNCGKRGCFETYCSIKRFKDKTKEILNIGDISPEKLLEEIKKYVNITSYNKETFLGQNAKIEESNNNSIRLKLLIAEYIDNLIIGLSNIIDIFEPEVICLGGSFVFYKDIFYKILITEMNKRKYVFNKDSIPEIVLANLKNDAGIIGAVL